MTALYAITMALLCASVSVLAAFGAWIIWKSEGRIARWWRFVRGQSRNAKRPLARTLRRVK